MKTVFFILTSKCNKNCPFCFYNQDNFRRKKDKLNFRICSQTLKGLKKYGYKEVTFTGGEPLLRKEMLFKLIKEAKNSRYITNIDTNGTLIDKNCVKKLSAVGLDYIYLSGEYFENINDETLEIIAELFKNTKIIKVMTARNLKDYETFLKKAKKYGFEVILQSAYINSLKLKQLDLKCSAKKTKKFLKILKNWADENNKNNYYKLIRSYYQNKKNNLLKSCWLGEKGLVIDSDGSVYPCFHRQDLICGNILKNDISDILTNRKKYSRLANPKNCFGEHCLSLFY